MPAEKGILSYFSPSSNTATQRRPDEAVDSSSSPRQEALRVSKVYTGTSTSKTATGVSMNEFDVVWAQIEGHPWWPGIVTKHPGTSLLSKGMTTRLWHVQFFGDPPTRGWVQEKFVHPYSGLNDENAPLSVALVTPDVKSACQEADKALRMVGKERQNLIRIISSDGEEMETEESKIANVLLSDDDEEIISNTKQRNDGRKRRSSTLSMDEKKKQSKRRKRIIEEESEDEYQPAAEPSSDDNISEDVISDNSVCEHIETPKAKKRSKKEVKATVSQSFGMESDDICSSFSSTFLSPSMPMKPPSAAVQASAKAAANALAKFSCSSSPGEKPKNTANESTESFLHDTLSFLQDGKRRDKEGRLPSHPQFNERTVYVPTDFLKKQTPGMQQWWTVKSDNFDTVLFFKVGKFYELYHMDAVIAVKELGLVFMKGGFAHAGFPEISFGRYSDSLIEKGYKIGRVEQTETPQMMEERIKKHGVSGRIDRVVRRELCAVVTKGTRTYGVLDGNCSNSAGSYLMALTEKPCGEVAGGESVYGVCFVDTSIGEFNIGQFTDDRQCSRLRTLLAHYPPAHILYERGRLLDKTIQVLQNSLATVIKDSLLSGSEFWDAQKVLKYLVEGDYFKADCSDSSAKWPDGFQRFLSEIDSLGLTAHDDWLLGLSALGAITWYLNKCLIDEEILSLSNFTIYTPIDSHGASLSDDSQPQFPLPHQHMILDDITLNNLEILTNNWDGSRFGTLLEILDHCSTAFGKRQFKQWLCAPPCHPDVINARLDAVEDLMALPASVTSGTRTILKSLPDLERQLRKIHALGSVSRSQDHPDSRAIMYEEAMYSKKKIGDLLSTLEGFAKAEEIVGMFDESLNDIQSVLLKSILTVVSSDSTGPGFPVLSQKLDYFTRAFDHERARQDGVIKPARGVDASYDSAVVTIDVTLKKLETYLNEQKARIGSKQICYVGSGRNRYQLEVPDSFTAKLNGSKYVLQSQRKGYKRYYTMEIKDMVATLTEAEERRDAALKDRTRRTFAEFDTHFHTWSKAIQCLSVLDVLLSMAHFSGSSSGVMCRPQFVMPNCDQQPFIDIKNGRHPCISQTFTGGDFIPNDTSVGISMDDEVESVLVSTPVCVLVTGPNMGGKSTLMRQTGVITIIAQLGCFVPCESCRLTPVDRVFTRLGAQDRIISGESTFFVELSETSSILRHATRHSLVLLDELGRGTSTYDGTAIACAVVNELAHETQCRTLFSTHYHSLVEEFAADPKVALGHMACMVENDSDDPTNETITFLYKFVSGACPKSYGFNAARLAGIPDEVISVAKTKAKQFEFSVQSVKLFRCFISDDSDDRDSLQKVLRLGLV